MASVRKFNLSLSNAKEIFKNQNLGTPKKITRFEKGMINEKATKKAMQKMVNSFLDF